VNPARTRRQFLRDSALLLGSAPAWSRSLSAPRADPSDFDFVIVGAGSSGCVIAHRLSADRDTRVLLVDAGGPAVGPAVEQPGRWTTLLGGELDWAYTTEPEAGLGGRVVQWPRGKALGGSSAINAMSYVRGHRLNFDRWAEQADASWSYRAVLPDFQRAEDNSRGASAHLGAGGPLAVANTTDPHAGHLAFLAAARELGFEGRPDWDFNGARQEGGAGFYQKNIRGGRRHSAWNAFVEPVLGRPNLVVWPRTRVRQVLIENGRVEGVLCARDGTTARVRARRGVVLAAGVIASPKILMLSGIGPAAPLRRLGIRVLVDHPEVGANLHDRPRVALRWEGRTLLPPSSVSAGLFTRSGVATGAEPPDIQFYVGRGLDEPERFITLSVAIGAPRSRGSIALRSSDPDDPPVIRANYFQEPRDLDVMLDAVRLARALAETKAYAPLRGSPIEPGPREQSADALRRFIRRNADTIFHPVGTCRMGRDEAAVVDPQLRVRGVDRLWVADASIMPELVNAQTHAACVMIGERLGRLTRND
jgi:choline dehydrogenase